MGVCISKSFLLALISCQLLLSCAENDLNSISRYSEKWSSNLDDYSIQSPPKMSNFYRLHVTSNGYSYVLLEGYKNGVYTELIILRISNTGEIAKELTLSETAFHSALLSDKLIIFDNDDPDNYKIFEIDLELETVETTNFVPPVGAVFQNNFLFTSDHVYALGRQSDYIFDIYKFDFRGTLVWKKSFDFDHPFWPSMSLSIEQNLVISFLRNNTHGKIITLDPSGNLVKDLGIDKSKYFDNPEMIDLSRLASTASGALLTDGSNETKPVIMKVSSSGKGLFTKTFEDAPAAISFLFETNDRGTLFSWKKSISDPANFQLVKLDPHGNIFWTGDFHGIGIANIAGLEMDGSGNVYCLDSRGYLFCLKPEF